MDVMFPFRIFDGYDVSISNGPDKPLGHLMDVMFPFRTFDGCDVSI